MALNDLINKNLRVLGLGLILAGCGGAGGSSSEAGCKNDSECKGNRICIGGECVEGSRNVPRKDTYSSLPDTYDLDTSQNCTSHFKKVCSDGDLYWQDSCKNLENKLDNCAYGCSNGKCNEPGKDTVSWKDTEGPSCSDECSNPGQTKCSGNGWKECDDYDDDSCLEWGDLNNCSGDKVCQNGECISTGCSSSEYTCNDGSCIPDDYVCDGGADCDNGEDEEGCCSDECTNSGQTKCSGNGWKECGDYDSDSCLEWSDVNSCSGNEECMDGGCKSTGPKYTCVEIDVCNGECGSDYDCMGACFNKGSETAKEEYINVVDCYDQFCSEFPSPSLSAWICLLENCKGQYESCFGQIKVGSDNCVDVWACTSGCGSDNDCAINCLEKGTFAAQLDYLKMVACEQTSEDCSQETAKCYGINN